MKPGFAFIAYPYVAAAFRAVFELIKNAPYVEVDGVMRVILQHLP